MSSLYVLLVGSLGIVVMGSVGYLVVLLAAACLSKWALHHAQDTQQGEAPLPRIAVVVPAHNEELVLAATLVSLKAQQYPGHRYEVVVVADNCSDATAAIAREHGATVLERTHATERGKGYALDWAFAQLLAAPNPADAFAVVDADTWVAPDFLEEMASRLVAERDARGCCALQGRGGVMNRDGGWRPALMAAAFDLCNHVKLLGQSRLGLSVGLKGNGMLFTRALLERARCRGESITEDIDFGLDLLRLHNIRVGYVPEARVLAEMPTNADAASTQRERWEVGRYRLLRDRGLPLLWDGMKRGNVHLCDAALSLIVPPLAELTALLTLWGGAIALGHLLHLLPAPWWWDRAFAFTALGLLAYVVGGLAVADASAATYLALLRAPVYVIWKFTRYGVCLLRALTPARAATSEWIRTARTPMAPTPEQSELPGRG